MNIHRYRLFPVAFFLFLYLLPLGVRSLITPDETRYAEIPREMITTGDWIVPHLNGVRYFEKPAMGYWVHAASLLVFGQNNFAVRLPSALSVGLSAILVFLLAGRAIEKDDTANAGTAALASIIFLTCFEVFGVGNTAVLDNLFALLLTAAVAAFYMATEMPPGTTGEKGWLLLAGIAGGMAFLTKGFLALMVPILALVPYLVWQRRSRDILRMGWLPMVVTVVVALPWALAIGMREPDFWHFFFWNEHIRRFLGHNAQHREPPWYFFTAAPAMFMPWTFLVPAAVKGLRQPEGFGKRQRRLIRLCICWLVFPFIFFSLSKGKLLTYILPCFPPFGLLLSIGLVTAVRSRTLRPIQWGIAGAEILFTAMASTFVYVQIVGYRGFQPFSQSWKALMVVNGLLFSVLFYFWALKSRPDMKKLIVFGMAPLLLFVVAHFTLPDQVLIAKAPGRFLERYRSGIGPESVVVTDEDSFRAVCWYLKRSDLHVLGSGELDYGMAYPDAGDRLLPMTGLDGLIRRCRGKVVLIARSENVRRWRDQLPEPAFMASNGPDGYSIWKF